MTPTHGPFQEKKREPYFVDFGGTYISWFFFPALLPKLHHGGLFFSTISFAREVAGGPRGIGRGG